MEDLSDAQVIAVSLRDPQAFGVVFDRHFRVIYGYLARRLSPSDADELAGEVFRVGFERRAAFDTDRASALPWLYGIASNLVLKHRRHAGRSLRAMARLAGRSQVEAQPDAFSNIDARLDADRLRASVVAALRSLTDVDRELVLLAAFSELSYRQLAEALAMSEGTVKSKLSRARTKLREQLDGIGEQQAGPQPCRAIGEPL